MRSVAYTNPKLWPWSEIALLTWPPKVGRYFSCSRVITRPNDDGFYPNIAHKKAHSPSIPKLVSEMRYHLRKCRKNRQTYPRSKPHRQSGPLLISAWIRWLFTLRPRSRRSMRSVPALLLAEGSKLLGIGWWNMNAKRVFYHIPS